MTRRLIDEIQHLHYATIQKQPPWVVPEKKLEILKNSRKVLKINAEPLKIAMKEFIFNKATSL